MAGGNPISQIYVDTVRSLVDGAMEQLGGRTNAGTEAAQTD